MRWINSNLFQLIQLNKNMETKTAKKMKDEMCCLENSLSVYTQRNTASIMCV